MIKLPAQDGPALPQFIEDRTQFLHDYAFLLLLWSQFEVALEVKIAKLAGLSAIDASIILGGLSFGNKPSILYSLLEKRGRPDVSAKIEKVIQHVGRNALVHGIPGSDTDAGTFAFFRREVGAAYLIKHLTYTAKEFNQHFEKFQSLASEAMDVMELEDSDLDEYASAAGLLEPTPPRPQAHLHREARDTKLAKKQQQRALRGGSQASS